jgi:RES domain-containing protein
MSTFYKLAYRVGFHPWEDLAGHPPFADTLSGAGAARSGGRWMSDPAGRCGAFVWPSVAGT